MKKSELFALIGNTMARVELPFDIIRGLGLDRTITMADMNDEVKLDQEDVLKLIGGLCDKNSERAMFWIGTAIRDLAK